MSSPKLDVCIHASVRMTVRCWRKKRKEQEPEEVGEAVGITLSQEWHGCSTLESMASVITRSIIHELWEGERLQGPTPPLGFIAR